MGWFLPLRFAIGRSRVRALRGGVAREQLRYLYNPKILSYAPNHRVSKTVCLRVKFGGIVGFRFLPTEKAVNKCRVSPPPPRAVTIRSASNQHHVKAVLGHRLLNLSCALFGFLCVVKLPVEYVFFLLLAKNMKKGPPNRSFAQNGTSNLQVT